MKAQNAHPIEKRDFEGLLVLGMGMGWEYTWVSSQKWHAFNESSEIHEAKINDQSHINN